MANRVASILFVCLGNICRSPLAEAIMRRRATESGITLHIDSAGTGSWHVGEAPCDNSVTVARKHGIDISGLRARQVVPADAKRFDLIVALDAKNLEDLRRMGMTNVCKLGRFGHGDADVPDPYFFPGYEGFEKVFAMIDASCAELLTQVQEGSLELPPN